MDSTRYLVPDPFIVVATQNPKGSAGTQLLPESQLDRFMICMSMGYPQLKDEVAIAKGKSTSLSVKELNAVIRAEELADFTICCPHWGTEYVLEQTKHQRRWAKSKAKKFW